MNIVLKSMLPVTMAVNVFFAMIMVECHAQWIDFYDPVLPRRSTNMAIGYYNQSIYLLYVLFTSDFCDASVICCYLIVAAVEGRRIGFIFLTLNSLNMT